MRNRRVLAVAALAACSVVAFTAPDAVQGNAAPVREPIAHTMVTQTQGPVGFASPNNVIPWGLDRIDSRGSDWGETTLDNTYRYSTDGTGVRIYVLDSGVDAGHVDNFGSRVVDGWSYRADSTSLNSYKNALSTNNIAACSSTYTVGSTVYERQFDPATFDAPATVDSTDKGKTDNDGHGTHVAGIAAGTLSGVAKNATIVPVRALDSCGTGTTTMVAKALEWIKADHAAGQKAVVNMSIGFDSSASSVDTAIRNLMSEGVIVVAAAGNSATSSCGTTPAGTTGTFSVGSSTISNGSSGISNANDSESYYSNYGDCVDLFAPGQTILSSWPYSKPMGGNAVSHTWWVQSGTSMAAPHVTGAMARWLQGQTLTVSSGNDVSANGWTWLRTNSTCDAVSYYGSGRSPQTANRLLAVDASVKKPCGPREVATSTSAQAIAVSFTASVSGNGAAVTGYTVTLSPGGASCTVDPSTATEPYSCNFTGLDRASTYSVSVTAVNSAGTSTAVVRSATTPDVPPPVTGLGATAGDHRVTFSWGGIVVGATYTVTLTPGGATCTSDSTGCSIEGLVNGQTYSASVVGTNPNGSGPASSTVSFMPDGTPEVPALKTSTANRSVTLTWLAVTNYASVTYTVTATPGGQSCTTTTTTCTVTGLTNGVEYSFAITISTGTGKVAASSTGTLARPAFLIRKTAVKKGSRTLLGAIITTQSKGRKTWSVKGGCVIAYGRMVAPKKVATCRLMLRTAKYGSYPAASTTARIAVR